MASLRAETGVVDAPAPSRRGVTALVVAAGIGAAIAVLLGVYARLHEPTTEQLAHYGFSSTLAMKAWLTSAAVVLAVAQALSAAWMWGRLPRAGRAPRWVAHAHRWTGTASFLLLLPVAYHCLWSIGWQDPDARVLVHGVLGCAFFGLLTTKLLALRIDRAPRLTLPLLGGALVVVMLGVWSTSSLWYFTSVGFPAF